MNKEDLDKERFKLHQALCERNETIEELQQRIDKALKLCNRYIANEKINRYPDYYYLSMFEEIKKELTKGSEE